MVLRLVEATGDDGRDSADRRARQRGDGAGSPPRSEGGPVADVAAWLRELVWLLGPVAPPIGIRSASDVSVTAEAGTVAVAEVQLSNRQGAATSITIEPGPLRTDAGVEWFPQVVARSGRLVRAHEECTVTISLDVPHDLPPATYRGSLVVLGMIGSGPDLVVHVSAPDRSGAS